MKGLYVLIVLMLLVAVKSVFAQERSVRIYKGGTIVGMHKVSEIDSLTFAEYEEPGVVISGVRWATRNVNKPGTFVVSPDSSGLFYQWNRKIGWSVTDPLVNTDGDYVWDASYPAGTEWATENDPCPTGWRVPTTTELQSLLDAGYTSTTGGMTFGVAPNTIFFPYAGFRFGGNGQLDFVGIRGGIWASKGGGNSAYFLNLNDGAAEVSQVLSRYGFSVRCVKEGSTPQVTVTVSSNPSGGGTTSGGGKYTSGTNCTVSATASSGYTFVNWTENGTIVSANANYTFQVTGYRSLVAKFVLTSEGAVFGGMAWAKRNVDAVGTFASSPESTGKFYQWNRKKAWAATGNVSGWDNSTPSGSFWETANDPCPTGWHVPTWDEFSSFVNAVQSTWTTQNGVNGTIFGTAPNAIFLPAAGRRMYYSGGLELDEVGVMGNYWCSTPYGNENANVMQIFDWGVDGNAFPRAEGYTVRCVADNY